MPNSPTTGFGDATTGGLDQTNKPKLDQDTLRSDAGAALDEAKSVAGKVANEARSVADRVATDAKDQVAHLAENAKEQVAEATDKFKGLAGEQKELLATQVGGVAEAMSRVASDLETSNGPSAHYVRMIADNADRLSSTIRDNDVDQILEKAQDFGRQQPAAFMGAAALLGFAASRFLLASAKRRSESTTNTNATYADSAPSYTGADASVDTTSYRPNNLSGGV